MHPPVRRLMPLLMVITSPGSALAQTTQPAPELPEHVHAALRPLEDFSFSFAQPGFFALLEHLKTTRQPPGHARQPLEIDDWTALLERPGDFRGLPITIEGLVGRNKAWSFQQDQYRHLGTVWQLELWRSDQPITATLILTDDATDIPVGATVRVTGYFVMIRQYYSEAKRARQSALLVAHGPTLVSQAVTRPRARSTANWILGLVITGMAALLVIWFLLRRSVGRTRRTTPALRASTPAPMSLADDLAAWAAKESGETTNRDERDETGHA